MREQSAIVLPSSAQVPRGVFAPGHLGELGRYLPVELVDEVLAESRTVQRRLRLLPSRVGVYFLLALSLFPSLGYARVWDKLTAGLPDGGHARPSEKALRDLRRRVGPAPLKTLFEIVAGPLGQPRTPGVCYRRWRTVAFDGCSSVKAPDQERNLNWLGKSRTRLGWAGYPMIRLMALCETGTRGLLGAVFGPAEHGEGFYARQLLHLLSPRTLLLADRGFDANDFLQAVAHTGSQLLIRLNPRRRPAVLAALPDGSYLTLIGPLKIRIIDAEISMTTSDGRHVSDHYRLATTLLDHRSDPAATLVRLYHERWEIESAFYALRHTLADGQILRSADPTGLEQEVWAQLTLYQVLRTAMVDAVESVAGTDPDRASFTIALEAARDHVVRGPDPLREGAIGTVGRIGRAVLAGLLPKRRPRTCNRKVKAPMSRYYSRLTDPRPRSSSTIEALDCKIHQAPSAQPPPKTTAPGDGRRAGRGPGRTGEGQRNRTLQLMRTAPQATWKSCDLARSLGYSNIHSFRASMTRWTAEGLIRKVGRGTYMLEEGWTSPNLTDRVTR
ncbi:IS4 family transposase [Streptomyces fructofermentans]|uniref:Transposase n=1 Tax=Streptomyces fructofermentans TaxID=152141 RepID=A0A918NMX8_9ACTN|nr:transposase [Streptomyces fructofermentans]